MKCYKSFIEQSFFLILKIYERNLSRIKNKKNNSKSFQSELTYPNNNHYNYY